MITCQRCGAQNADHSKFCLSCGNDLRPMGGAAPPGAPPGFGPPPGPPPAPGGFGPPPGGFGPPPGGPGGFGPPPGPPPGGFGPPPGPPPAAPPAHPGFGPPPGPPPAPGGFGPPPAGPPKFGPPGGPPPAPGGFGPPPAPPSPGGFGPPPPAPGGFGPPGPPPPAPGGFGAPPQPAHAQQPSAPRAESSGNDLQSYSDGLRAIALELRGIAASKSILSTQILPSPLPGVAALGIRYGRSMHVICAGGQFGTPIWPSRDFSDRDKLLAATIGNNAPPEQMIPWVLTYVLPGVFPDLGKDEQSKAAFVEAADAFGVGVDQAGIDAARRQGFPEIAKNHARFLVVSEPKQSIAGIELRWGDRPFEMLYVPTPGVVARSAPWT